jgi:hypothetical protein
MPRISTTKATFNNRRPSLPSYWDEITDETIEILHLEHRMFGAETWILRKVDQKYLESLEICCWRRIEKIVGKIV